MWFWISNIFMLASLGVLLFDVIGGVQQRAKINQNDRQPQSRISLKTQVGYLLARSAGAIESHFSPDLGIWKSLFLTALTIMTLGLVIMLKQHRPAEHKTRDKLRLEEVFVLFAGICMVLITNVEIEQIPRLFFQYVEAMAVIPQLRFILSSRRMDFLLILYCAFQIFHLIFAIVYWHEKTGLHEEAVPILIHMIFYFYIFFLLMFNKRVAGGTSC